MKKQIILRIFVVILIVILGYESYSFAKILINSNKVLENVKTIDVFKEKDKAISIMLQDENMEWSEAEDRSKWPTPDNYTYIGSKCTDSEGAEVNSSGLIEYSLETNIATINTKNTIYCTLYFAKGKNALDWLKEKGGATFAGGGQHTTAVDGMYRYVGTASEVNNNYICFGTTDENKCIDQATTYMYRIIGITSADQNDTGIKKEQLKLIKATPSSTNQKWGNAQGDFVSWDTTLVKNYLNSTFYNTIKNAQQNGSYWEKYISNHKWYTDTYNLDADASLFQGAYSIFLGTSVKRGSVSNDSKIGLMYPSDYTNACKVTSLNTSCWMYIANGWKDSKEYVEMTTGNRCHGSCRYWQILSIDITDTSPYSMASPGLITSSWCNTGLAVRPVFYLQSGISITGEGSKDHPYIITSIGFD